MWKKIFEQFLTIFRTDETSKNWSSTRFTFVFTVLLSNVVIFTLFAIFSMSDGKFPEISEGVLWLYAIANGIAFTGKVSQKFKEGNNNETNPE